MRTRRTLSFLAALGAILVPGRTPAEGQEAPTPPTFTTTSELVVLDLVVRDKGGRLVTDLRSNEIEVLENGEACRVQSFELVRAGVSEAGLGSPSAPDAGPAQAKASSSAAAATRPNVVLVAFDRLGPSAARVARKAADDFVARPFPPETWLAVVALGEAIELEARFTQDVAQLPAAIAAATAGSGSREPARGADQATATREAMTAALVASDNAVGVRQVDPNAALLITAPKGPAETKQLQLEGQLLAAIDSLNRQRLGSSRLHALAALARALGGLQGRKTLLYFSEGLMVPEAASSAFDTVVSEANRANVAIYAFDPRGLAEDGGFEESKRALLAARHASEKAMRSTGGEEGPNRGVSTLEVHSPELALDAIRFNAQANLRDLAEATGGFLVADTNDLGSAIERVGADLRAYYQVGYVPANPTADGAFRNIDVKLKRRGLTVRTRRGYFALPPGQAPTLPYELVLAESLGRAELPHDFTHQLVTQLGGGAAAEREVALVLQVPIRELRLVTDEARQAFQGHASMLVLVRGEDRQLVAKLSHDWPLSGPANQVSSVQQQSLTVRKALSLRPGRYTLECAVQDRLSGALSAKRSPLVVP